MQRPLLIHACIVTCQDMRYPSADHRDEISERKCSSSRSVASLAKSHWTKILENANRVTRRKVFFPSETPHKKNVILISLIFD